MSNDDTLISKLLVETYEETSDKDQPNAVVDLRHYFERKLNEVEFLSLEDYLAQNGLAMSSLKLVKKSQCYRLNHNDSVIDFPSNWSIFKEIKNEDIVFVDQSLDQDFLLDIFSELNGDFYNLALVKDNQVVMMIYLPEESSKEHVQWFRGYFEKKKSEELLDIA